MPPVEIGVGSELPPRATHRRSSPTEARKCCDSYGLAARDNGEATGTCVSRFRDCLVRFCPDLTQVGCRSYHPRHFLDAGAVSGWPDETRSASPVKWQARALKGAMRTVGAGRCCLTAVLLSVTRRHPVVQSVPGI
jgi:hypothetical protein